MKKTNAMRELENHGIEYEAREYDVEDGLIDGVSVAEKLGLDEDVVFKTLVCQADRDYFVFMVPVHRSLDLKKAAKAVDVKKIEMLPMKELKSLTGYEHGGCSPVGMKKSFPSYLDESARDQEIIGVSAGKVGAQMLLHPDDLLSLIKGEYADLVVEEE